MAHPVIASASRHVPKLPRSVSPVTLFVSVSPAVNPFLGQGVSLVSTRRRPAYQCPPCRGAYMSKDSDAGGTQERHDNTDPQDSSGTEGTNDSDDDETKSSEDPKQPYAHDQEQLVTMGRFREFIAPNSGDERTRDDIAQQALKQALYLSTSESIDSTIQANLNLVSDLLSDLYARSEREIIERNEKMALRSTLPIMSKVNQKVMAGQESLRLQKMAISKELQLVEALLKRSSRKKPSSSRRNSSRRRRPDRWSQSSQSDQNDTSNTITASILSGLINSRGLLFTAVLCIISLETFETVMASEGGTEKLANISTWSALVILSLAYLDTLRSAARKATNDLERRSAFHRRGRDRQS